MLIAARQLVLLFRAKKVKSCHQSSRCLCTNACWGAALRNSLIPKVNILPDTTADEEPEVDIIDEEYLQIDTSNLPVIITLTKASKHYIVDATLEEESQMSSAVSISLHRNGQICGLIKRGGAGLHPSVILDMISVTKHVSIQYIVTLDSEISTAEASFTSR